MNVEEMAQCGALMAWRDDQSSAAIRLIHEAAAAGLAALEKQLGTIAVVDAFGTADLRARAVVRPAMRDHLRPGLNTLLRNGAAELRRIDSRLEALALSYVHVESRPVMPGDDAEQAPGWFGRLAMPKAFASRVTELGEKLDAAVPDTIRTGIRQWSDRTTRQIGEGSGARARLRVAGADEVTRTWAGPSLTGPGPFLSLILEKIDLTTNSARELIS